MEEDIDNGISRVNYMLEHFSEYNAVNEILDNVLDIYNTQPEEGESEQKVKLRIANTTEIAHEKLKRILNQYIDQPHLLDLYIEKFLSKLIYYIKDPDQKLEVKQEVFRYMFLFVNVRGYKVIVRLLPHEVCDLELALTLLEKQYADEHLKWETRYCLLLWLSIIVMIPFEMSRLDRPDAEKTIAERIIHCCKAGLMTTDKSRDAAAFTCARFVTRPDIKNKYLGHIIQWACDTIIIEKKSASWKKFGPLIVLASIFKHGKREDLKLHTEKVITCIVTSESLQDTFRLSRKYAIKIIQRIGLCYLNVKAAAWRYQQRSRTLSLSLSTEGQTEVVSVPAQSVNQSGDVPAGEEYEDVPVIMEEVIAQILKALRDDDITTRWSAAKGIGRITERLSAEFCDQIVENILTLLGPRESSCSWNGACLALAEFGRRGLLLPTHLPMVVKVLLKALVYEETHGIISAGSYVRDSACYTCWSLARSFDSEVIKPFVNELAGGLLIVASFDREMNCRKAASAAFQEHVGRQGGFPHGIEMVRVADYFNVSIRKNAFLNVSTSIAKHPEYTRQMIDHLVECKIGYWDPEIRELSSKALYNMLPYDPVYVASKMKHITKNLFSINLNSRHGAILSLGEIIHSLANVKDHSYQFDDDIIKEIKDLVPKMQAQNLFRGIGGDLMKEVCCFLIMKCSLGKFPVEDDVIDCWGQLIYDCLSYEHEKVRLSAALALSAFVECHYVVNGVPIDEKCKPIIEKCRHEVVSTSTEADRIGYSIALSLLPKCVINAYLDDIIASLTKCATKTDVTSKWVHSRKAAHESLITIWKTFYSDCDMHDIKSLKINPISTLEVFFINLDDYTVDKRGDIGSFVRESSLKGLQIVITNTCQVNKHIIPGYLMEDIIVGTAKEALDKISRIRISATHAFHDILNCDIPEITHLKEIRAIFANMKISDVNWNRESVTFPLFAQLLQFPEFTRPLLAAFTKCVGSITESLVKETSSALTSFFKQLSHDELANICVIIVEEFQSEAKEGRTTKSMLTFLERMFAYGIFTPLLKNPDCTFAADIYHFVRNEITKTKDSEKLTSSIEIFCQLLQVGGKISKLSLGTLCRILCHNMIWLRKTVALSLDQALDMYGVECGLSPESEEKAKEILSETDWENPPIEEIRTTRNKLCELFGIPIPQLVTLKEVT